MQTQFSKRQHHTKHYPPAVWNGATTLRVTRRLQEIWGRPCPETMFACPDVDFYCLPVQFRCNGVSDCPGQEDEAGCDRYRCPGKVS